MPTHYPETRNREVLHSPSLFSNQEFVLQTDYGQVQKANSRLSERLQEVKLENKSLRRTSADYAQLKQILGAEQIEATLNAAKRLKQSEKGCKQPQRSVDHGVR